MTTPVDELEPPLEGQPEINIDAAMLALYREEEPEGMPCFEIALRLIDADGEREVSLIRNEFTIGTGPKDTFFLRAAGIEPHQLRGQRLNCGVVLSPRRQSNSVELLEVGGQRVQGTFFEHAVLRAGDRVRVGDAEVQVILEGDMPPLQGDFAGIVGRSRQMVDLYATILRLAPSNLPVLIVGPTGTGKEAIARAVHTRSRRADGPFEVLNCGGMKRELVTDLLFGHEKNSFTDAKEARPGLFEQCHGGTIFLDEIGEMPMEVQADLLRVLQDGEVRRIGAGEAIKVDVRVVAATNVKLRQAVRANDFREDLYYRLKGAELEVPPLRQRMDDLPRLVQHFLRRGTPDGREFRIADDALEALFGYSFPGNIRELEMMIVKAMLLCRPRREVQRLHLQIPELASAAELESRPGPQPGGADWVFIVDRSEADLLDEIRRKTIRRFGGNKSMAAKALGISRTTLKPIEL